MKNLEITFTNAQKAFKEADEKGKTLLTNMFGKEVFSQKITDRIKSFEDACAEIGEDPIELLPYKNPKTKRQFAANDAMRLDVIAEALRGDFEADWSNSIQRKWRCWFEHNGTTGFGFSGSGCDYSVTFTRVGSRLCMPTEELSNYFGTQFIEIHNRLLTNKY